MIFLFAFLSLTIWWAVSDLSTKNTLKWIDANMLAGFIGLWITILLLPYVLFKGIPSIPPYVLWLIIIDSVLYFSWKYFNFIALKEGELSYMSPLKGMTTIWVAIIELMIWGMLPSFLWIMGLFLMCTWVYMLNMKQKKSGVLWPILHLFTDKGSQLYLFTMVCFSISSLIDKVVVVNTYPAFWMWLSNLMLFGWSLNSIFKAKKNWLSQLKEKKKAFFICMLLNTFTQVSQMYMVARMLVSYTSAFKSASSFIAVFLWGYFLKEKGMVPRLIWATVIFLWIMCMSFFWG